MGGKLVLLSALIALAACCPAAENTIGIYPGNPQEDFSPRMTSGGKEYRNLALNRAAIHSSAWDYDHTAQLVTDGLLSNAPGAWMTMYVDGQEVSKLERELLIDFRPSQIVSETNEIECELIFHGYSVEADKVIACATWTKTAEAELEASADGVSWDRIGKCRGRQLPSRIGETDLIRHGTEFVFPIEKVKSYTSFRIKARAPEDKQIRLLQLFFYRDGECIDALPGAHFSSSWKSGSASEEWISVDLGSVSSFDRMAFHWLNAPCSGKIQVSRDGKKWKDIVVVSSAEEFDTICFPMAKGRYVRAMLSKSVNGEPFELSEWEIFGKGGTATVPSKAPSREGNRQNLAGGSWKLCRAAEVSASGEELSRDNFDDALWMDATVPGTVLASYVNTGAVRHPNYADNQTYISDSYFRSDFWYRKVFAAHPDSPRQFLHFCGVNRKADVFLNGSFVGTLEGAFREKDFDVTGLLAEGDNTLAVRVGQNRLYGTPKEADAWWPGQNGGVAGGENPTMHATMGWDWFPTVRGRNIGIYDDVYLDYTGEVTVEEPFVQTLLPLPDTTSATILARVTLVNHGSSSVAGMLKGSFGELTFEKEMSLAPGERSDVTINPLRLDNPKLWWPKGYGEPNLYGVHFAFEENGVVSDSCSFKAGVRQMDYKLYPYQLTVKPKFKSARNDNQRLDLYVNGRRFTGFGGNWGYPEHLMNYREREYDIAVGYHADMNFNLIRNWVGMTGSRHFYEACDRHGVMVWQDFWLANPGDGPDPRNPELFEEVADEYVRRIRNHPSIALYVGRNEGYPPEELDLFLKAMVEKNHPGMQYISHSSTDGVSGGGPYHAMPVKEYFRYFGHELLHSERGMPAIMNYENLLRTFGEDWIEPVNTMEHPNEMYGKHDYCLGGGRWTAQRTDGFNRMLEKAFGEPTDAREFASLSQWLCYDGYRAIFEGRSEHRRGMLLWMSHPSWPSLVWQTYDYYFEPTAAYFGARKACEPVHILLNPIKDSVTVVNYCAGALSGLTATACVLDMLGKEVWSRSTVISALREDETLYCFSPEVPEDITDVYFVKLTLTGQDGALLSENFYWQGKEEGNYQALRTLGKARVSLKQRQTGKNSYSVLLKNMGSVPALMIRLKAVDQEIRDLALPVWYSDNNFFLMPGESKEVAVSVEKGHISVKAEGFNL